MSANGKRKKTGSKSSSPSRTTTTASRTAAPRAAAPADAAPRLTKIQVGPPKTAVTGAMANVMTLARVKLKPEDNRVALAARVDALARANAYEAQNRSSGFGVALQLAGGEVFWSKSQKACPIGCFGRLDDWGRELLYSEVRRGGVLIRRWSCIPLREGI